METTDIVISENCKGDCSVVFYDKEHYKGQRVDTYACEGKTDPAGCLAEVADFYQNRDYPKEGKPNTLLFVPGLSGDAAWHLKVKFDCAKGMANCREAVQDALSEFSARGGKKDVALASTPFVRHIASHRELCCSIL